MANNDLILLGKRIAEIRAGRSLSQDRLSDLCGISTHHISELERGKTNPTYMVLKKIASAMEVPISSLLDFRHLEERSKKEAQLVALIKGLPEDRLSLAYRIISCLSD